jgi:hypothetical protein
MCFMTMILEMKFAYAAAFLYACLFTTWRQNTFLTDESSAAQTIDMHVMHC